MAKGKGPKRMPEALQSGERIEHLESGDRVPGHILGVERGNSGVETGSVEQRVPVGDASDQMQLLRFREYAARGGPAA
jgi:hypothetical protein